MINHFRCQNDRLISLVQSGVLIMPIASHVHLACYGMAAPRGRMVCPPPGWCAAGSVAPWSPACRTALSVVVQCHFSMYRTLPCPAFANLETHVASLLIACTPANRVTIMTVQKARPIRSFCRMHTCTEVSGTASIAIAVACSFSTCVAHY